MSASVLPFVALCGSTVDLRAMHSLSTRQLVYTVFIPENAVLISFRRSVSGRSHTILMFGAVNPIKKARKGVALRNPDTCLGA